MSKPPKALGHIDAQSPSFGGITYITVIIHLVALVGRVLYGRPSLPTCWGRGDLAIPQVTLVGAGT